ncbi:unnamed protein product [Acanthocheilonema viteae]|uniref:Uncharacterized protein n=1 Tax=Acanthocheilonema viteae TaxID=6277 RepID=A0A498SG25_ACAVI|nr:unnamed protein product [Acanthocheilonema viteae]
MAEESFNGNISERMNDFDASDVLYLDSMNVANEVVVETYFQQQQGQLENLMNASEMSTVQPIVHESYTIPDVQNYVEQDNSIVALGNAFQNAFRDEQREMLEMTNNLVDSSNVFTINTTHYEQVDVDEVVVTTSVQPDYTDPIIDKKIISGNEDTKLMKEVSLEQEDKLDPVPLVVRHQTEIMSSGKTELIGGVLFLAIFKFDLVGRERQKMGHKDTDGNGDADSQSPDIGKDPHDFRSKSFKLPINPSLSGTSEEFSSTHRMLTRSAAKAAKSAEVKKTPKKRKMIGTSSTSSSSATPARSARTSSAKKNAKKPRRSCTAHK